jgi:hypothetical protein
METDKLKDIPESERWVFENPEILKSIDKGIKEAKEGKLIVYKGYRRQKC